LIELTYRHQCDRCHVTCKREHYELWQGMTIPHPARTIVAGMTLCEPCAVIITKALTKAMQLTHIEMAEHGIYPEGR
jgi:hypothetical protein